MTTIVLLAVVAGWVAGWIWFGRHHMLDDALIHLRFAERLRSTGVLTYNDEPSYGSSSILFLLLLASLRDVVQTPLLPKIVSVVAYAMLGTWIAWQWVRSAEAHRGVWLIVLLALTGPLGIRWLTDGMETSLSLVAAAAVGATLAQGTASRGPMLLAAGTAAIGTLVRIEMAALVALLALARLSIDGGRADREAGRRLAAAAVLGSSLAIAATFAGTGHLISDAAVAKAGLSPLAENIRAVGASVAAGGSFGAGLVLVWVVSIWPAWRATGSARAVAIANAPLPGLVALALARGQFIHGFRYFAWAAMGSIVWNVVVASWPGQTRSAGTRRLRRLTAAAAVAIVCIWIVEWLPARAIVAGRAHTYRRLAATDFQHVAGKPAVAADIGFFGYFSNTDVCDLSGLVNGRAVARLPAAERAQRCAAAQPLIAFLTDRQSADLSEWLDVSDWTWCGSFDFTNIGGPDRHHLLVRGGADACPPGTMPGASPLRSRP